MELRIASSSEWAIVTEFLVVNLGLLVNTMLCRFAKGRNFRGIKSQVLLPMTTESYSVNPTNLSMSDGSLPLHGMSPFLPMTSKLLFSHTGEANTDEAKIIETVFP